MKLRDLPFQVGDTIGVIVLEQSPGSQQEFSDGDRDEDSLVAPLDPEDSMIVSAILHPTTLQALLGDE